MALKATLGLVAGVALMAALLLIPAGRTDWTMAWAFLGTLAGCITLNLVVLWWTNRAVIAQRLRLQTPAKAWDAVLVSALTIFSLGTLVVAGLDRRFAWSPLMPSWLQIAALPLLVMGDLAFLWAMSVNQFFSKLVRVQTERGHRVITAGPYRYVRHPGYVGWSLMWGAVPVVLGSLWAFVPAGACLALIVVRTALEDRMLRGELPGYEDYAHRVRHRLLPGVW